MNLIAVSGYEQAVLERWLRYLRATGNECVYIKPSALVRHSGASARICLYDLGPRGGADIGPLLTAVSAFPETRFIAMSARPEAGEGLRLLRAGIRGYSNRLCSQAVLGALLATVENGEIWAGRQVTDHLLNIYVSGGDVAPETSSGNATTGLLDKLTAREADIASQVAEGLSNKVIAIENGISERTVKAHLNSIFRKTGIRNRVQLALAVAQDEQLPRQRSSG